MTGAGGAEHRSAGIAPTIPPPLRGRTYRGFTALTAILLSLVLVWQGFWLRDTFVTPHRILQELTGNAYWSAWTTDVSTWWAMDGSNGSTWAMRLNARDAAALKQRCGAPLKVYPVGSLRDPVVPGADSNAPTEVLQPRRGKSCFVAGEHHPEGSLHGGWERGVTLHGQTLQVNENYF